ncbi:hypothetical protein, partial [Flavobacterium sp. SaA2.13]|uniref:hypothetical protein n=1 Tax=Flavobacterium sp. SaA2.13 TaxID=2691898 RepID=UPI001CEF85F9
MYWLVFYARNECFLQVTSKNLLAEMLEQSVQPDKFVYTTSLIDSLFARLVDTDEAEMQPKCCYILVSNMLQK